MYRDDYYLRSISNATHKVLNVAGSLFGYRVQLILKFDFNNETHTRHVDDELIDVETNTRSLMKVEL